MTSSEFQNKLLEYFWSDSLKTAVVNNIVVFSELELCKIVVEYIERYEDKISLLKEMLSFIDDSDVRFYVEHIISRMIDELNVFKHNGNGCVFELKIKDTPDSYEERYLCYSFESALNYIDCFYNEYGNKENPLSTYTITKRRILNGSADSFCEDFAGECTINYKREICSVVPCDTENHYLHFSYNNLLSLSAVEISFPHFVEYKDLVKYRADDNSINYGICMNTVVDDVDDEYCLIIPLNCFALRYNYFEKAFDFHTHIAYWNIEKADVSELKLEEADIYRSFLKYADENYCRYV